MRELLVTVSVSALRSSPVMWRYPAGVSPHNDTIMSSFLRKDEDFVKIETRRPGAEVRTATAVWKPAEDNSGSRASHRVGLSRLSETRRK